MSTPDGGGAQGRSNEEILATMRKCLVRYWQKQRLILEDAEDLAQEGLIQIWLKGISAYKGTNGATALTYLQKVGINKGRDRLEWQLRRKRNDEVGGQEVIRAQNRTLRNPGLHEKALVAFLDQGMAVTTDDENAK